MNQAVPPIKENSHIGSLSETDRIHRLELNSDKSDEMLIEAIQTIGDLQSRLRPLEERARESEQKIAILNEDVHLMQKLLDEMI